MFDWVEYDNFDEVSTIKCDFNSKTPDYVVTNAMADFFDMPTGEVVIQTERFVQKAKLEREMAEIERIQLSVFEVD